MAKSSRASSRKVNNQRLKAKVFGPVEAQRNERLSQRLLELAAQPKPETNEDEGAMKVMDDDEPKAKMDQDGAAASGEAQKNTEEDDTAMDVDVTKPSKRSQKKRIEKRKTSKIVFPKYKDKVTKRRKN